MGKTERAELEARGLKAARVFLGGKGMEILNDEPFECEAGTVEIVARSWERGLVFATVATRRQGEGFPSEAASACDRDRLEKIALAFLADWEETDIPITFDRVDITAVGEDRALMRWRQDILF